MRYKSRVRHRAKSCAYFSEYNKAIDIADKFCNDIQVNCQIDDLLYTKDTTKYCVVYIEFSTFILSVNLGLGMLKNIQVTITPITIPELNNDNVSCFTNYDDLVTKVLSIKNTYTLKNELSVSRELRLAKSLFLPNDPVKVYMSSSHISR